MSNEISREEYFSDPKYLRREDRGPLKEFLDTLSQGLESKRLDAAILAVGSSTFPKAYWDEIAEYNRRNPGFKQPTVYDDIDLRIVPKERTPVGKVENAVKSILKKNGYKADPQSISKVGRDLGFGVPFAGHALDYTLHTTTTQLSNGTSLDLILGRLERVGSPDTATAKIEWERKNNKYFSLLYHKSD